MRKRNKCETCNDKQFVWYVTGCRCFDIGIYPKTECGECTSDCSLDPCPDCGIPNSRLRHKCYNHPDWDEWADSLVEIEEGYYPGPTY